MALSAWQRFFRFFLGISVLLLALAGLNSVRATRRMPGQGITPVTTVSAASFTAPVAPDSIAAAFGVNLATRVEIANSQPLPTTLAGTSVRINGQLASLFFVSPGQINFLIPPGTPAGIASVIVTSGNGMVSNGTVQIAPVAPALFTANASGQGALAAVLLRVKADGRQLYEPMTQFDSSEQRFVTLPIDFGEESDLLFLVLYLTGVRQAATNAVRVSIGGVEYSPLFAGAADGFAGLDQINVALPRNFGGRGRISLLVKVAGANASNAGEFEIGAGTTPAANAPMQINSPSQPVLAGEEIEISGSGFAANPRENTVQIIGGDGVTTKAEVLGVNGDSLRIRVPFGAGTGQLKVSRGSIEASAGISMRTSVSGFIEQARRLDDGTILRVPIPGARVRTARQPAIESTTDAEGSFVLPDVPPGLRANFEILPPTGGALNFPSTLISLRVQAGRDNQFTRGAEQTTITGAPLPLGDDDISDAKNSASEQTPALTFLLPGRTPANLPVGHFSSSIAQVTPFSMPITPGRKLTFPNNDAIPAGATARLFKFDQTPDSATLGQFIEIGTATVSADGQRVETAPGAVTEGSYYFASIARPLTAISGRVVESDGRPVPRAIIQARGQSTFTDGFGGFVLRDVPVIKPNGDKVRVEVSYQRPDGRIARRDSDEVEIAANALSTIRSEIVLDAVRINFPPVILAPAALTLAAGEQRDFGFIAGDPDSAQAPAISLSGSATVFSGFSIEGSIEGRGAYRLTLAPNLAGSFTLSINATDAAGARTTQSIAITVNQPNNTAPIAHSQSVVTLEDAARQITLAGRDPAGQALNFAIVTAPARGRLSGAAPNLTYTPSRDFGGVDSFTFKASNGVAESQPVAVYIIIAPVNDAPALNVAGGQTAISGQNFSLIVSAEDADQGQSLKFSATGLPAGATFSPLTGTSWQLSWSPTIAQAGSYPITFRVEDDGLPPLAAARNVTINALGGFGATSGQEGGIVRAILARGGQIYAGTLGGGVFATGNRGRSWTTLDDGLGQDFVYSLGSAAGGVLAGTSGGIFRLRDGATRWEATNLERQTQAILVSGAHIFAATASGGVWLSTDDGRNWSSRSNGLPRGSNGSLLSVNALAEHSGAIFAGTEGGGVRRSPDGGQNWTNASSGLPANADGSVVTVRSLAFYLGVLYAGLENRGVYLSRDNGANWTAADAGLQGLSVNGLLENNGAFHAAALGGRGVYRLNSDGQSWTTAGGDLSFPFVTAVAASGSDFYAGTFGQGVFRSPGAASFNWIASNAGLTASFVYAMAARGTTVLSGTLGGLFRSTNNGQIWTFPVPSVSVFAVAFGEGAVFAGTNTGVLVSTDDGVTWSAPRPPNFLVQALLVSGGNVFAGTTQNGVFRSPDNGATWMAASNGLPSSGINDIAARGNVLFAGTGDGLFRSTDQGASWQAANNGLTNLKVQCLVIKDAAIFAGTFGGGVFRSRDDGASWTPVSSGLPSGGQTQILKMATNGQTIFASGAGLYNSNDDGENWTLTSPILQSKVIFSLAASGANLYTGTVGGAFFGESSKQSWAEANNGLANKSVNTITTNGPALFAGMLGSGAFRSGNQGASWTAASNGLPANANVQAFAGNGTTLFAALFGDGVYRSTDQGASWAQVNNGLGNRQVNALTLSGGVILTATNGGVFRSTDGGASWTPANAGLTNLSVLGVAAIGSTFFAGTDGGGVFISADQGASWTAANNGLTVRDVRTLVASGNAIFVGTLSGGVFRSTDNGQSWTATNTDLPPRVPVFALASAGSNLYAGTIYGVFISTDQGANWKQINAGLEEVYVTGFTISGDQLFASTASGGVFVSRIPQ